MTNTLDPGYAAAARRRGDRPSRRWFDRPAAALGCLLIGFTFVVAYIHTNRGAPQAAKVQADLVARVRAAEAADAKLDTNAQALSHQIDGLRDQALNGAGPLRSQLQLAELAAGTVAVKGPGVTVQLSDPPAPTASAGNARKGSTPIQATQLITDRDVRSVVNQLWSEHAEAIAVNNVRLTPTSAIRFAGEAVLVDFQPITEPYVIRAIGDPNALDTEFAASDVASRYQTLASAEGIRFQFDESSSLQLPASAGIVTRYASPIPSATRPPAASVPAKPAPSAQPSPSGVPTR